MIVLAFKTFSHKLFFVLILKQQQLHVMNQYVLNNLQIN